MATRYENYENQVHGLLTMEGVDRAEEATADIGADLADALDA